MILSKPFALAAFAGLAAAAPASAEELLATDPTVLGEEREVAGPPLPESHAAAEPEVKQVSFGRQLGAVPLELAGLAIGLGATRTGSIAHSDGFHFQSEGWFGRNDYSLGADKVVHAWTSFVIADFLESAIRRRTNASGAAVTAGLLSFGLAVYAESFDGFSKGHGVAYQDLVMNFAGAGFSVLRNSVPGLKEKVDFRMEYVPSGDISGFHPLRDYSGQRYIVATTLAGFEGLENSPLRFVELHAGYYARGFTDEEKAKGKPLRRHLFVGIGLNVKELLFGRSRSAPARFVGSVLDYVQVPYTSVHTR